MENTKSIYLDYNSTSIIRPAVLNALTDSYKFFNASSVHHFGVRSRKEINNAREAIAKVINVDPDGLIFTSGATEANVSVIENSKRNLLISAIEHDSVIVPANYKPNTKIISVLSNGLICLNSLEEILKKSTEPYLISTMLVNNETGVIQPIKSLVKLAHKYNALVHCDAVQALGKIPINIKSLGVDYATFSAHKIGGPQGIGVLWVKPGIEYFPLIKGGGQENFKRAGTENISGIIGFSEAVKCISNEENSYILSLRNYLEVELSKIAPIVIFGEGQDRIPNTLYFGNPKISKEVQLIALDLFGIGVSSGSACSSGKVANSHVLQAMGVKENIISSAIRVSLGWATKKNEIDYFVSKWSEIYMNN